MCHLHWSISPHVSCLTVLSDNLWPPCPYYDKVPDRKGNPYILVTEHDRKDHGDKAGVLAKVVCNQMLAWLLFLPQASYIHEEHWESNSYGGIHAIEYSIFMEMAPIKANENLRANEIDRETAYYAMEEFCNLVAVFGAMQGNFEFWSYGHKRMTGTMHIFEWPSGARAQE